MVTDTSSMTIGLSVAQGEQLSAFMDGELADSDTRGILVACRTSDGLAQDWSIYHCIGDVLRSRDMACHSDQLAADISRCLASEPHHLAPATAAPSTIGGTHRWRRPASVAAAVAAVAVVLGAALPRWSTDQRPALAAAGAVKTDVAVARPADALVARPASIRVPGEYITAHRQFSGSLAMQGAVGRARGVAYDAGQ